MCTTGLLPLASVVLGSPEYHDPHPSVPNHCQYSNHPLTMNIFIFLILCYFSPCTTNESNIIIGCGDIITHKGGRHLEAAFGLPCG